MKKSNILLVFVLVVLVSVGGYFGWTKYQEKLIKEKELTQKEKEEPSYLKYRPKESVVKFSLESTDTEQAKVGDIKEVALKIDTKGEKINKFRSVFKYYAKRMAYKDYKLNPEFKDAVTVAVDEERGYVTIESSELKTPISGEIEIIKLNIELNEEGLGFFDLVNGDLEAMNLDNENIANIQEVKSIQLNILPKEGNKE